MSDKTKEALNAVSEYLKPGTGMKGSVQKYNEKAEKYEEYMATLSYTGHRKVAETAAQLLKDDYDARILDVGAGSGLVAVELLKYGYKNMDAVDAAADLLEIAKQRGLYKRIVCQYVGEENMPFEDNTYDMVVSSGAINENHIPKAGVRDIIRVVKPGGYVALVFREEAARAPVYEEGLEPFMQQLEKDGMWKMVSRSTFPNFIADKEGLVIVYQVL